MGSFRHRVLGVPVGILILFLAFADLMLAFPHLDLAVSGFFYTPGSGFEIAGTPAERLAYHSVPALLIFVNLALIGLWLYNRLTRRGLLDFDGPKLAFLLCLLILVPGLIVNQVLKEHWGRARPVNITEFGGKLSFTPAFVQSDQHGGAFSSGHAAAAFYLTAVAVTLFGRRSPWTVAALGYGALVGLARIAAGGHFLSDVITSGLLVLVGYLFLEWLFVRHRGTAGPGD
jgi:lipid A 4'-phosphatase